MNKYVILSKILLPWAMSDFFFCQCGQLCWLMIEHCACSVLLVLTAPDTIQYDYFENHAHILKLLFFNLFLQASHYPILVHLLTVPHPIPPSPHAPAQSPRGWLHPTRPPHSLGPQVSWGLGAPCESWPGSPLLHMCWGPLISLCMLPDGGSVFERSWGPGWLRLLVFL